MTASRETMAYTRALIILENLTAVAVGPEDFPVKSAAVAAVRELVDTLRSRQEGSA